MRLGLPADPDRGAGVDDHYPAGDEPCRPADQDFGRLDNVLMTPHSSGVTRETYRARIADIVDNVSRVGAGRAPRNEVRAPAPR